MSDIAFKVLVGNGYDDILFKTIMLKGEKGDTGETEIDDSTISASKTWSSQKINSMIAQTGTIENVEIASFSDGADDVPVSDLIVDITAVQAGSGVPSPDNVRRILGFDNGVVSVCGKNFLNAIGQDTTKGFVDRQFVANNGALSGANTFNGFVTEYFPLKANTQYIISGISGGSPSICFYDTEKNFISGEKYNSRNSFTFTTGETVAYARASIADTQVSTAQIEKGSTATTFEAYKGNTYTFDWGANLWNEEWEIGAIDSSGNDFSSTVSLRSKGYMPVLPNVEYNFIYTNASTESRFIFFYDSSKTFISSVNTTSGQYAFTTPNNAYFIRFSFNYYIRDYGTYQNDIIIKYPSVYGGYFDNKGNLVVTHGGHQMTGTENWAWAKSSIYSGGFFTPISSVGAKAYTPFICSQAKTARNVSEYAWGTCVCDGSLNFRIMQANDTVDDWKNYLANQYANGTPVSICYELANPITLPITAQAVSTLLEINNIFANTGKIKKLVYFKTGSEAIARMIEAYMRASN